MFVMELVRTARVRIDLPLGLARKMVADFTAACNYASGVTFKIRGARALAIQTKCYQTIRKRFDLSAQVAVSVTRTISARYMTLQKLKRPPSKPIVFNNEPVALQGGERGRDFRFFPGKGWVAISTPKGRLKVTYNGPPRLVEFLSEWKLGGALLTVRGKKAYLLVSFSREVPGIDCPNDAVVGVDRGIRFTAVATDGDKTLFLRGGHQRTVAVQNRKRRASLQSRKAQKNTRSLRRVLKRSRGREMRFNRDVNHVASRRVVEFAQARGCPTIVVEDLKGIRGRGRLGKRARTEVNAWPFYQFADFLTYKAQEHGFVVIAVDPRNTSRGCAKCGYTDKSNRSGLRFKCRACGHLVHSDLNASRNIRLRGILARQVPCVDGLPSISPQARPYDSGWNPDEGTGKPPALAGSS